MQLNIKENQDTKIGIIFMKKIIWLQVLKV